MTILYFLLAALALWVLWHFVFAFNRHLKDHRCGCALLMLAGEVLSRFGQWCMDVDSGLRAGVHGYEIQRREFTGIGVQGTRVG